jgi:hypothetical protein
MKGHAVGKPLLNPSLAAGLYVAAGRLAHKSDATHFELELSPWQELVLSA